MVRNITILLFAVAVTACASDWTGASWERILDAEGTYFTSLQGLNCAGDTVYLMIGTDEEPDGVADEFRCYKWYPYGLDDVSVPLSVGFDFREMNYDSVDRVRPAFMTTTSLHRPRGASWVSTDLTENQPGVYPQCFCFDSTGALHYADLDADAMLNYHRRGGGRADRDASFDPPFVWGWADRNSTRIVAPTGNLVVVCAVDVASGVGFFFRSLYVKSSVGDAPFSDALISVDRRTTPRLTAGTGGAWIYGQHRGYSEAERMMVIRGSGSLISSTESPVNAPTGDYNLAFNPRSGSFEVAAVVDSTGPQEIRVVEYSDGNWQQRTSVSRDEVTTGFHLLVDSDRNGRLFVLDSLHLWYFGPPATSVSPQWKPHPEEFSLSTYPNPFNGLVTIRFSLEQSGPVELSVYDLSGRRVELLTTGFVSAGSHVVQWDAKGKGGGIYFVRLVGASETRVAKLLYLR